MTDAIDILVHPKQESLKEGMDLSAAINRIRFDGLAAGVYRRISECIRQALSSAALDIAQLDEVRSCRSVIGTKSPNLVSVFCQILLVGASTLLPGIANHLALQVSPTVPITSTLDPSQVIAVGCALQAYHLAQLPRDLPADVVLDATACKTSAFPIGIVFPGLAQPGHSEIHGIVVPSNIRLPCRRRFQFAVAPGAGRVAFELWEASTEIDISQVQPQSGNAEDESDEDEEEPEEVRTVVHKGHKLLTAVQVPLVAETAEVVIEVIMTAEGELSWRLC